MVGPEAALAAAHGDLDMGIHSIVRDPRSSRILSWPLDAFEAPRYE
jgi:hypothetical protein